MTLYANDWDYDCLRALDLLSMAGGNSLLME